MPRTLLTILLGLGSAVATAASGEPASATRPEIDCYISNDDNYWVAEWLPFDSPAAVKASVGMLKGVLNVRRIYWRGLEDTQWADGLTVRKEAYRRDLRWIDR